MKKKLYLLLSGVVLLAAPVSFTSCDEKDEPEIEIIDGEVHDPMYGKFQKYVEDVVGTFHYDEEIIRWYAEDENHVRYYFVNFLYPREVDGAEEGKQVRFMGDLYSVSDKWFKDHEQYKKYEKTGLYIFYMDTTGGKYVVDGETYYCQMMHNDMAGKYLQYIENYTGTLHYDEEIAKWYAEDENHARFYFVFTTGEDSVLGAVEGKQVVFGGDLYSVSAWWFEDHEQYRKYKETGLNVYEMDSPRGKYIIDGKTYVGIDIRLNKL